MQNAIPWFDIPVVDMSRAMGFYEQVTGQKLKRMKVDENKETALFESGGCLFQAPEDKPSHFGSRVYLDSRPDINGCLERVKSAGGKVLLPRTPTGANGFFAYFEDSEGNRVGLHVHD